MSLIPRPTIAHVDLAAIEANFRWLAARTGRRVMPVVKADAYGHGAVPVARALENAGADFFCVAIAEEGIQLRRGGVAAPILLLNYCEAADMALHRAMGLTPTLSTLPQIHRFVEASRSFSEPQPVHLKIDTGLTRLGILPEEIPSAAELLRHGAGLRVEAVFTHFSHGDTPDDPSIGRQEAVAHEAFAALRAAGVDFSWTHLANSGVAVARQSLMGDGIRPGLSLYGVPPSAGIGSSDLKPAFGWETEIFAVKSVPEGTPVGYGGTFVTRRLSRLAVLPVGYDDGYRRAFSGKVPVLLSSGPVRTVGVISMDLTLCDVTDTSASPGDRVVLLGSDGAASVTVADMARAADTIPYEIFCGIGPRVPRIYS